jgi:hypothetical protein
MFTNGQIFLIFFEHFPLPQAGSVANIPESLFQHRGINQLMVRKPMLGRTLSVARTCTLILGWGQLAKPKSLKGT